MLSVLANRAYRHLFLAQAVAMLGTGLATVALALLAYDLAGADAGAVLGTALAIKMLAYVGVAPVAAAFAAVLPRRALLVGLDLLRAGIALALPFVTEVWQIYVLILALQSASAAFTPAFQASIPDVLPQEDDYTRALSLSRLANDLESLISPALAAALLALMSFHFLFVGTALGFLASAALVISIVLPRARAVARRTIYNRTTRGIRIYLKTPRLQGLLAVSLAVAAAGALVIVNTVVYVQVLLGLGARETAFALAAFGGGSMLMTLFLPRLLGRVGDRPAMLAGAALLVAGSLCAASLPEFVLLLPLWALLGAGYALAQTPAGRLLRRSAHAEDRPAVFAAQFALSHACWLLTYPLAGWLGATAGLPTAAVALAAVAAVGTIAAVRLWPAGDPEVLEHSHPDLPADHPHWQSGGHRSDHRHAHAYVIDDLHFMWPHGR